MLYCSIVNEAAGKVFPQVKLTHVKKLPIRIASLEMQRKIRALVEKLLNANSESADEVIVEKIDVLIGEIYELERQDLKELSSFKGSPKNLKKAA